jgi:hypothetical protein
MFQILCVKGTLRQSKVSLRSITQFQESFFENIKKSDKILTFLPKILTIRKVQSKLLASIFMTGKEKNLRMMKAFYFRAILKPEDLYLTLLQL